jgi:predicted GIY-YIG superfamily endonuclease
MRDLIRRILLEETLVESRVKWTDEMLRQEAQKYATKSQFIKHSSSATQIAQRRGEEFWKDITSHMEPALINWTDEMLRDEALKYSTKKEFQDGNPKSYQVAYKRGKEFWGDITSHMDKLKKDKWTDDELRQEALRYNTLSDFEKFNPKAYGSARRRNKEFWSDITSHMNKLVKWTEEGIKDEALKYKTRSEFSKNSIGAYTAARRLGILDDVTAHMELQGSKFKRLIYAYEFPDNSVYVGLTFNMNQRNTSHMNSESSAVFQHMTKTGLVPVKKTLTVFMDKDEASKKETEIENKYRSEGWIILNRTKTGGLGGNKLKWDRETIRVEALKYNNLSDFYIRAPSAIQAAKSLGEDFYQDVIKHMSKKITYWTDEMLRDEALKYDTKNKFAKGSNKAYNAAKRRGEEFFNSITSHMQKLRRSWTEDELRNEALKYDTKTKFRKGSPSAFTLSRNNGSDFYNSVTSHMNE